MNICIGPRPDALRKADGSAWRASAPDDFGEAMKSMFDQRANCYYFIGIDVMPRWYGTRFKKNGKLWEFRDPQLFDLHPQKERR